MWVNVNGNYPEYKKLVPTEFNIFAYFDTEFSPMAYTSGVKFAGISRRDGRSGAGNQHY